MQHPVTGRYLQQAEALAAAVHNTLGFTRDGSRRLGALGAASADHPTRGGLRIGKPDESGELHSCVILLCCIKTHGLYCCFAFVTHTYMSFAH